MRLCKGKNSEVKKNTRRSGKRGKFTLKPIGGWAGGAEEVEKGLSLARAKWGPKGCLKFVKIYWEKGELLGVAKKT